MYYSSEAGIVINKTPCPELYVENGNYLCKLAGELKEELAIGAGCCSGMNSQRARKREARHG